MGAVTYEQRALYSPKLVHRTSDSEEYVELTDAEYKVTEDANGNEQTVAMAYVNEGGAYVVEDEINVGAVVAIVVAGLVFGCHYVYCLVAVFQSPKCVG